MRTHLTSHILAMEQYSAHRPTHLYRIYSNPTHDKHQWLLLQFIVLLKMDAKGVRNMQSILVVFNKHNTARVPSCWFVIYYIIFLLHILLYTAHRDSFQGAKRLERGVDHPPSSATHVTHQYSCTCMSPLCLHGADRHTFMFIPLLLHATVKGNQEPML